MHNQLQTVFSKLMHAEAIFSCGVVLLIKKSKKKVY